MWRYQIDMAEIFIARALPADPENSEAFVIQQVIENRDIGAMDAWRKSESRGPRLSDTTVDKEGANIVESE